MVLITLFSACGTSYNRNSANNNLPSHTLDPFVCPSISDNIAWTTGNTNGPNIVNGYITSASYGPLLASGEYFDGVARQIVANCGWYVYQGHNGGVGDTLWTCPHF